MRKVSCFGGFFCGAVLLGIIGVVRMASGQCCGGSGRGSGYRFTTPPTNCVPAGCTVTTNGTASVTNAVPRAIEPTPSAPAGSAK